MKADRQISNPVGWPERKINLTDTGFTVSERDRHDGVQCQWATVLEVFAYKIDLFAHDEICLGFRFDAAGNHWWVGESYTGYQELVEELPHKFPGIRTDWFSEVMIPAFVENRTRLWGETLASVAFPPVQKRPWWKMWP